MSDPNPLPTDLFSRTLRSVQDNPGALGSGSTVHVRDFYGNAETWVVETYRLEDGTEYVFIQRNGVDGGSRHVIPPQVAATLARHRDALVTRSRRRAARKAVVTKRLEGTPIGNADALLAARTAPRKGKRRRARKGGRK